MGASADNPFDGVWDAFADAGLLDQAWVEQAGGDPLPVMVDLRTPDELEFDSRVTVSRPTIEYRCTDAPDLDVGTTLTVNGVRYRVRNPPRAHDDGVHMTADLEVIR